MLLDDVVVLLAEVDIGTPGENLFLAEMPPDPDNATCVREYGGPMPSYVFGGADPSEEYPRFQVECRATEYAAARARIERCARALGAVRDRVVNGTHYHHLTPLGAPVPLGADESGRARIVVSVEAVKAPSPLPV